MTMPALPAQASFWMECEYVVAGDIAANENGLYAITPISSKLLGGDRDKHQPCQRPDGEAKYPIIIKIDGDKPQSMKKITLHYGFFSGVSPHGVINSETWMFVQPTDEPRP
jgi:hypothetical protein